MGRHGDQQGARGESTGLAGPTWSEGRLQGIRGEKGLWEEHGEGRKELQKTPGKDYKLRGVGCEVGKLRG